MKLISTIIQRIRPGRPAAPLGNCVPATGLEDLGDEVGRRLQAAAASSLDDQFHQLIDRNADGVNRVALRIRRDSDLLLSLGISDPMASKAGTLAQYALELANGKRGMTMEAVEHNPSSSERAELVIRAMSLASRAEMLLAHAKSVNAAAIEVALSTQARLLKEVATSSYGPLLVAETN